MVICDTLWNSIKRLFAARSLYSILSPGKLPSRVNCGLFFSILLVGLCSALTPPTLEEESRTSNNSRSRAEIVERVNGTEKLPVVAGGGLDDGLPAPESDKSIDHIFYSSLGFCSTGRPVDFEIPRDPRDFWAADPSPPTKSL